MPDPAHTLEPRGHSQSHSDLRLNHHEESRTRLWARDARWEVYACGSHGTSSIGCIPTPTHTMCRARAPHQQPPTRRPRPDNDQARKTTEHGEQRGDGVDVVDPGDPARSGGGTNRLNTRRNSQSKWSKEKRLQVSSPSSPERQRRASAQPAWACPGPQFSLARAGHVPHHLSAPPPRLLAARGCPRKPRQQHHRPQPAQGATRPTAAACRWRSRRGRCRRA